MATVNVTVVDEANGNAPIPGLIVDVYDGTGAVFITSGTTDNSGEVTLSLPLETYVMRGFKAGVVCSDFEFTVDTNPETVTYECSSVSIAPPASPQLCRLYADFISQDGLPVENFKVQVHNLFDPTSSAGLAVVERVREYLSDESGHVEFDVVRGLKVRVVFVTTPLTRELTIPSQPTANLLTLMGEVSDAFTVVR